MTALLLGAEIASYHYVAYASSGSHGEKASHGGSNTGHGDAHAKNGGSHGGADAHGGHHPAPPVIYYIYWILLIFCLYKAGIYLKKHHDEAKAHRQEEIDRLTGHERHVNEHAHAAHEEHDEHDDDHGGHGHHPEPSRLDKLLVALVVAMFLFEQVPSLAHFHEANSLGFVKFLLKATLGVALMTYGILGMGEH